ncbi:hypothetical protein HDV06_002470 [Boothiomyces sp. JEL0866]|nr:hypothetical protein HDV06_002470 [Boothiomyces sp. JEL0866]
MEVLKTPTKTPVKPLELGSPQSSLKPIPHLVFLIDPKSVDVKVIVVRILLLFYIHVNPLFTWGYEIINYEKELKGKKLGVAKHGFGFTHDALQQLASDLDIAQSNEQENLKYLTDLIRQVAIQAQWNNSIASHLQSPLKKQSKPGKSIKIRNYLFIVSPLPKDLSELNTFLSQKELQLDELLEVLHQDFLSLDLWNDLLSERICLYWINSDLPSTNEIVAKTESWLSNALRLYGGRYLDYYTIYSENFRHYWKDILKIPSVDGQICQLFFTQNSYSLFLESFDKVYFNFGSAKHPITNSISLLIPETFFPFSLSLALNFISDPRSIESVELNELKVIGWISNALSNFDHFVAPKTDELSNVNSFNTFFKFCLCQGISVVLSNGERLSVLSPLMPNLATISSVDNLEYQTDYISPNINLIKPYNISVWYSVSFPDYLQEFLKSGLIRPNCTELLTGCLMGMFALEEAKVKQTPQKLHKPKAEKQITSETQMKLPVLKSLSQFYETFEYYYSCILYEKFNLNTFLADLIPQFYEQLVGLAEADNIQAPQVILDYFTSKLIKSVSDLDLQSKKRVENLAFLYSKANSEIPSAVQTLVQTWFLKQKQKFPPKSDLKIVLKKSLKDLSITEAKLQMVLVLECLRISKETEFDIPTITLPRTPKRKSKTTMKDNLEKLVEDILDRIMISSISLDLDNESSCYYSSLPDLCESLKIKSGGNLENNDDPFDFPLIAQKPKKRRVKEEPKPLVTVQKAPSKLSQMRRQVISTKKPKNKPDSRASTRAISLSDFRKPLDSNNGLKSPTATRSIYIPETPTKPKKIDFLQSPSKRPKRNFEDILATPNK